MTRYRGSLHKYKSCKRGRTSRMEGTRNPATLIPCHLWGWWWLWTALHGDLRPFALAIMIGFSGYLRPSEMLMLQETDLVPPQRLHNMQVSDYPNLQESLQELAARVESRRRGTSNRCWSCRQTHVPRTTFSHAQLLRSLVAVLLSECTVTHWPPCTCMAQATKHFVCVSPKNIHTASSSGNVVHFAEPDTMHGHTFLILSWISLLAIGTTLRRSTATAECRPDGITTSWRLWAQLDCWRPGLQALCRRRSVHWTRGFTCQTLVFPPVDRSINQWLSGKQRDVSRMGLRRLHLTTYRNEKQVQNDHKFISLTEKNLMSSSSQDPTSAGKPVAVFSSRNRLNQDTFSDRDEISLRHLQVFGSSELFIRFSDPASVAKSLPDGNRDHMLAEARSELMKQEHQVESLNSCISELQQQTCAQRLKLQDAPHGFVESREEVRQQEELVMKEKALQDTQIGRIHEMGEFKRAQELRFDENKSWHDTGAHFTNTRVAREGELQGWKELETQLRSSPAICGADGDCGPPFTATWDRSRSRLWSAFQVTSGRAKCSCCRKQILYHPRDYTTCKSPTIHTFKKVFKNLQQELNLAEEEPVIGVGKFIPMPQAMKIPDAKAAVET